MPTRAVVLLSGGLDSMLAVRILQEQGIEVEALNFRTLFACCQDHAGLAADELGVRLTVLAEEDDYLDVIRAPRFGYGRGANPCIDCRIYMFRVAARFMRQVGASLVASGEVAGQRPMSQKKRDLLAIAHHSGLQDRLLRPLSAKLLPATEPELCGEVDRERLYGFCGRGRKPLIALARHFGFRRIPGPSTGCALTEPEFAGKVHDLVRLDAGAARWDFELLKIGRHFRQDQRTKVVIGRRAAENEQLLRMIQLTDAPSSALVRPDGFPGPTALVVGPAPLEALEFTGGLILRFAKETPPDNANVRVDHAGETFSTRIVPHEAAATAGRL